MQPSELDTIRIWLRANGWFVVILSTRQHGFMYKTPYYASLVGSRYLSLGGVPVCCTRSCSLQCLNPKECRENVVTPDLIPAGL